VWVGMFLSVGTQFPFFFGMWVGQISCVCFLSVSRNVLGSFLSAGKTVGFLSVIGTVFKG